MLFDSGENLEPQILSSFKTFATRAPIWQKTKKKEANIFALDLWRQKKIASQPDKFG